jgi:hypothetical protein
MGNELMTNKEMNTRKLWLRVGFINWIILPSFFSIVLVFLLFFHGLENMFIEFVLPFLIMIAISAATFYHVYYCAYLKFGTKLLNFYMIMGVIGCFFSFLSIFNKPSNLLVFLIEFSFLFSYIWFLVISASLLSVNKKIQKRINKVKLFMESTPHENNS